LLLPSPLTSTEHNLAHVHTTFWESVREYVSDGGTVYASVCADTALPEMGDVFGATLTDHTPAASNIILTIVRPFGGLKEGEEFHFNADPGNPRQWPATLDLNGGEIIAVDQDDRPAIFANSYGKGLTLLCSYPIECYLANTPSVFEDQENSYNHFRALWKQAGVRPMFATDHPSVEVAGLTGPDHGYAVLVNHQSEPHIVTIASRELMKSAAVISAAGSQALELQGRSWQMPIAGHSGAIVK
jgi:hypothetical protein